jgi:hypothetical protein
MTDKAKFLILDGPRSPHQGQSPAYRGTYRCTPPYCEVLPEDHEINELFMWFIEEGGELGVVHDVTKALRFAKLCNEHFRPRHFEVVQVVNGQNIQTTSGRFLGFDLSHGYNNSLLYWGLKPSRPLDEDARVDVLWQVVSRFFAPQLNENGLFSDSDLAALCLRSLIALQSLKDNLFEGDDLAKYELVGVCLIPEDHKSPGSPDTLAV